MIGIGLNWSKAHRYEATTINGARVIRQVGAGRDKNFDPFKVKGGDSLYLRFAKLDSSEESCLRFAHAFGLLTTESPKETETLDFWRKEIRKIKGLMNVLEVKEKPPGGPLRRSCDQVFLPSITVRLVPGELDVDGNIGRPKLLLGPKDLLEAMYLQLGKFVAGDGLMRICAQCGSPFEGATKDKRSHAIYCTVECKDRASYEKRRAAK